MKLGAPLTGLVLLAGIGGLSCGTESPAEGPAESQARAPARKAGGLFDGIPKDHHLAALSLPLFPPNAEDLYGKLRRQRQAAGLPETELTDRIPWAKSIDEAFARATKEDKPLLLVTFVRENGEPDCDV